MTVSKTPFCASSPEASICSGAPVVTEQASVWEADFWTTACAVYQQAGMQAMCLVWQDNYHGHVNGLLFAIWCDLKGHSLLSNDNLRQLDTILERTHNEDVAPLRQARLAHTDKTAISYQTALAAELAAEKRQQQAIIQWALTQRKNTVTDPDLLIQMNLYCRQHIATHISDPDMTIRANALIGEINSIVKRVIKSV